MDRLKAIRLQVLHTLETAASRGGRWLFLLWGWIFARNLLESLLEAPRVMGFDWRGEISFGMVFLHFPLFYIALFLGLVLMLHLLLRRPIERVAAVVASGFAVILSVPLIDGLLFPGRGADLSYMPGLGSVLWDFWNPSASLEAVSPGQRFEIVFAMHLVGAYCVVATRRHLVGLLLGLVAGAFLFLWSAFLGAWPALVAKLVGTGGSIDPAYLELVRGPGLIASESRRHALLFVPWVLGGGLLFLWRRYPLGFGYVTRHLMWSRLAHYSGMAPAGFVLGWIVYHRFGGIHPLTVVDYLAAGTTWAAMAAAYVAAWAWNVHHDRAGDELNAADTAGPTAGPGAGPGAGRGAGSAPGAGPGPGGMPVRDDRLGWAAAGVALVLALVVSYHVFLLLIACVFLAWAYSVPPLRLKRWPLLATGTLATLTVLSLASGFALFGQEMTLHVLPSRVAWMLWVGVTLGFTAKDLKDARGDRAAGTVTLATLLPDRAARWVTALLVVAGYAAAIWFLRAGLVYTLVAVVWAGVGALLVLRVRRPDTALLWLFLIFAVFALVWVARQPGLILGAEPGMPQAHARLRSSEEILRRYRLAEEKSYPGLGFTAQIDPIALERGLRQARDAVARETDGTERIEWDLLLACAYGPLPAPSQRDLRQRGELARNRQLELTSRRPLHAAYYSAGLQALHRLGASQAGVELCSAALSRGVRPGDFVRHRAALRLHAGEAAAAARDVASAYAYGQERAQVWLLAGDYNKQSGRWDEAGPAYERALGLEPDLADAHAGLGEVAHARGDLKRARMAFEQAHRFSPGDPWIANNLGVVLRDLGHLDLARTILLRARQIAPAMFEPLFNLGLVEERAGHIEEARGWYRRAAEVRPGFPPVLEAVERLGPTGSSRDPDSGSR